MSRGRNCMDCEFFRSSTGGLERREESFSGYTEGMGLHTSHNLAPNWEWEWPEREGEGGSASPGQRRATPHARHKSRFLSFVRKTRRAGSVFVFLMASLPLPRAGTPTPTKHTIPANNDSKDRTETFPQVFLQRDRNNRNYETDFFFKF